MSSTPRIYAVMGATGKIGHVLAEELLRGGHTVRAIGRTQATLAGLRAAGAQAYDTPFHDAAGLSKAFEGVSAAFTMIPPAYEADDFSAYQDKVGDATIAALKWAKVPHVVALSSLGAQWPAGTGPIAGLHRQEARLNGMAGLNVIHLRPGYFMENQYWSIPTIKQRGVNGSPMRGDVPVHMVATQDIGRYAAELLLPLTFRAKTIAELAGPRPYSLNEATSLLGHAIGRPDLKYVQFPPEDARKAMLGMGMKPSIVGLMLEMQQAFNDGRIVPEGRAVTGPTTFEAFANGFAKAYQGEGAAEHV